MLIKWLFRQSRQWITRILQNPFDENRLRLGAEHASSGRTLHRFPSKRFCKIGVNAMKSPATWLLILMTLLIIVPAAAADDTTSANWTQGVAAFAEQDYLRALSHFERARNAGQTGPAVHYNIAVCQYKLQLYDEARQSFTHLDDHYPNMRPLAQYNLGLVARKLSQPEVAVRHFRESYYLSVDDPKLRAMSSTMLRRMIGDSLPSRQWMRMISVRGGYDDNVTLQDEAIDVSGISADSPFVEIFGSISGPYAGHSGFRLDGGFFLLQYSDADEFNQASLFLGGVYEWRARDWGMDVGAHAGTTTLGGDGYERSGRLTARVTRQLTTASSLAVRYRYDDITAADAIFDDIEGSRQRIDLRYRWYSDGHVFKLGLANETNDRADPGVSPDRNRIAVEYRYSPETGWGFGVGAELRGSDYDDVLPVREEDLTQVNLSLLRNAPGGWQFFAQYTWADNDSSEPVFSYTRNQLSIGVFRLF